MSLLGSAYFTTKRNTPSLQPEGGRNLLLSVNGLPSEVDYYHRQGWHASAVVSLEGVLDAWSESDAGSPLVVSPQSSPREWVSRRVDAVVCTWYCRYIEDFSSFLDAVSSLLLPGGRLLLQVEAPSYCHRQMRISSRDILPWPTELPMGSASELDDVLQILPRGMVLESCTKELDSMTKDPGSSTWKTMSGFDCSYKFPTDEKKREASFTVSQTLILRRVEDAESPSLGTAIDENELRDSIAGLFEKGRIEEAALLLSRLENQGDKHPDTWNLRSILHFYRQEWEFAWTCICQAFAGDSSNGDMARNLVDIARKAGREEFCRRLLENSGLEKAEREEVLTLLNESA